MPGGSYGMMVFGGASASQVKDIITKAQNAIDLTVANAQAAINGAVDTAVTAAQGIINTTVQAANLYSTFSNSGQWSKSAETDPGGGAGVWGAWVEMVALTGYAVRWIDLRAIAASAVPIGVQLGLGAAGVEAQWLPYPGGTGLAYYIITNTGSSYTFPANLAAGQRISLRTLSVNPGVTTQVYTLTLWA